METSTSMASNLISKILECPICFEEMSQPKMLPCQHTFCLKCTQKVATRNQVQCVLCQRKHQLPVTGAKGLPNNATLIPLINSKTNSYKENLALSSTTIPEMEHHLSDSRNRILLRRGR